MLYGYCSITSRHGSFDAQEERIKKLNSSAIIIRDNISVLQDDGLPIGYFSLLSNINSGDTVILTRPERIADNSDAAFSRILEIIKKNAEIEFCEVEHLSTTTIRKVYNNFSSMITRGGISFADFVSNIYKDQLTDYLDFAFSKKYLRNRQREISRRINGSHERRVHRDYLSSMYNKTKNTIIEKSKFFNGTLGDAEVMKLTALSRNTYYKYKKAIKAELMEQESEFQD